LRVALARGRHTWEVVRERPGILAAVPVAPDALEWSVIPGPELDTSTLYDVLALRSAVFVVEQACAYQDIDGLDLSPGTRHVLGKSGAVAAYARVLAPGEEHVTPRIGRVIVDGRARGQQLGRRLMERALATCAEHWPGLPVELGAQAHLTGFYASLGFEPVGGTYDEDGILHQWMRRPASS
jgi:ElaA protein